MNAYDFRDLCSHPAELVRRGPTRELKGRDIVDAKDVERQERKALRQVVDQLGYDTDPSSDEEEPKRMNSYQLQEERRRALERQRKLEQDGLAFQRQYEREMQSAARRVEAAQAALQHDKQSKSGWTSWW